MEQQPLVSVIINCYNGEKYLREAIDSVIAQTYSNWELIFWDNQSTDSTAEIVKSYKDERIRYFYALEHTPLGEARNLAMKEAKGEYMAFLDADDIWDSLFVNKAINVLSEQTDLIGFYSSYFFNRNGKIYPIDDSSKDLIVTTRDLVKNYNIALSACLFATNVLVERNMLFDNSYKLIEDYDFFIKLSVFGNFYYSSEKLMTYRLHVSSSSYQLRNLWYVEYLKFLTYCNSLVENRIINDSDLTQLRHNINESKIDYLIEKNNKTGLFVHLIKEPKLLFKHWKKLYFIIVGRDRFKRMWEKRQSKG